jgi:hypothetical protein
MSCLLKLKQKRLIKQLQKLLLIQSSKDVDIKKPDGTPESKSKVIRKGVVNALLKSTVATAEIPGTDISYRRSSWV